MSAVASPPAVGAVLGELRRARLARRPGRRRDLAYRVYASAIFLVLVGVPLAPAGRRVLAGSLAFHIAAPRVDGALGFGLTGLLLLACLVALRFSTWQGPVVLSAAMVTWVAPLPLSRRGLLGRRLNRALLVAAVLGALLGAAAALVLAAFSRASPAHLFAAGLVGAVPLAVLFAALGVPVERSRRLARAVLAASPVVAAVAICCLAGCGDVLAGHAAPGWLGALVLWCGPWGWAAQPMAAAAGVAAPAWPVALGVLGATTATAVVVAYGCVGSIPTGELRVRAGALGGTRSALFLFDVRAAHRAAAAARPLRRARARPLPMRGHRLGLVLWRDAVGLVRAPAEVSSAAFLAVVAVVAVVAGPLDGGPRGLVVLAVLAAYGAATRLVESARREADEPGLASSVLMDRRSLARAHVAVPSLALFLLGAAAAGAAAGLFGISAADLATLVGLSALCWPLVVLGALVAAYKGPTPYATAMLAGQEMGALVLASWAIGGLAFVLVALVPCIEPVLAHDATRRGVVSSELVVGALSYAIGSAWLGRRVRRAGQGAA